MRRLCFVVLLLAVMAGSAFAATVGTWYGSSTGPPYTGLWTDLYWNSARTLGPPAPPGNVGDDVKFSRDDTVCTINSVVGNCNWNVRVGSQMVGGAAAARIGIVAGGSIGIKELRIGDGGNSGSVANPGYMDQTGGTLTMYNEGNIKIGRMGNAAEKKGIGYYTISGGTINYDDLTITQGNLFVGGCGGSPGVNGGEGTFTVVGSAASITARNLYVGGDGTYYGKGTLEFQIGAGGVSPITVGNAYLDPAGVNSTAILVLSLIAAPLSGPILLVDTSSVTGTFDTFTDSLGSHTASEGASVTLSYGGTDYLYTLTYNGSVELIPEPATMVLLGLGSLIAIRRRRK
jgi:hypothetical protein